MALTGPTDTKQALAETMGQARALIEAADYETATDRLEAASALARPAGAVPELVEIRSLAHTVWLRTPRGSDTTDRANRLFLAIGRDEAMRRPSNMHGLAIATFVVVGAVFLVIVIMFIYALATFHL